MNALPPFAPPCLAARFALCLTLAWCGPVQCFSAEPATDRLPFPRIERFESFGPADGLPAWKVHCVLAADAGKVWIGTTKGLAVRDGGRFRLIGPEQGLSHSIVLALAVDPASGDLWIGTARGLNRWSAGRITTYTQTSSGLPNNVVYGVAVWRNTVWVATAAGLGALDLKTGSWRLFDHTNTVMHEPWVYAIAPGADRLFVGVWGGGIVEHDPAGNTWKEYRDPDGEMELTLLADSGPVHDVTSGCAWSEGVLWQATYFGLARYAASRWKTYVEGKSGLASNFVNFVAAQGAVGWVCTDRGLGVTDGETWANYRRGERGDGLMDIVRPGRQPEIRKLSTALPDEFVLGVSVGDRDVWIATAHGLGHGFFAKPVDRPVSVNADLSERN
jgi:ligand-binding sensor domain-containing protein